MDGQLDEGFNVHEVMDGAVREDNAETKREITKAEVATNLLAGLTTSSAAIGLGAAFGVSSGALGAARWSASSPPARSR